MTTLQRRPLNAIPPITWEKLPADFPLPDDPVESNLQPLLAAALRESLELAGLIVESALIASNFGLCATVAEMTAMWLRWWNQSGNLLLWGGEQIEQERQRADQESQRVRPRTLAGGAVGRAVKAVGG